MGQLKETKWVGFLRDPEHVWKFQSYFGVKKIKEEIVCEDAPWIAVDYKSMPQPSKKDDLSDHEASVGNMQLLQTKDKGNKSDMGSYSGYNILYYQVGSPYWEAVFQLSAQLGHELFFILFFVFTLVNLDSIAGRKIMLAFNITMYTAQALKDLIRIGRPAMPHVVQREFEYALEYGMPSTHSMNSLAIVSSTILFTHTRYAYPLDVGVGVAGVWCFLVCSSRLYLGMHTWADILAGLSISACSLNFTVPFVESVDDFLVTSAWAPLLSISVSSMAVLLFPRADRWTPSWGDSSQVMATYLGVQLAHWALYQNGYHIPSVGISPFSVSWPSVPSVLSSLARFGVTLLILVGTKVVFKPVFYLVARHLFHLPGREQNLHKTKTKQYQWTEVSYQFLGFLLIGFNGIYFSPVVFSHLGLDRQGFFTII